MDHRQVIEFILGNSYASLVDPTLKQSVSMEFHNRLAKIEESLQKFAAVSNLDVAETEITKLVNYLLELITDAVPELTATESLRISTEQSHFIDRIMQCTVVIQTYASLRDNFNVINDAYAKLMNLSLTNELNLESLKSMYDATAGSSAGEFIAMSKRKATSTYDMVYGIDDVKEKVQNFVDLSHITTENYIFLILSGPPGTGKSTLAHCIASHHSDGEYYNLNVGELSSEHVGATERGLREIFGMAATTTKPLTIIFDEMDTVVSSTVPESHLASVKATIQTEISGSRKLKNNVMIVGITNYSRRIDPTIKRRATLEIYVPPPSLQSVLDFLFFTLVDFSCFGSAENKQRIASYGLSDEYKNNIRDLFVSHANTFTNSNIKAIVHAARISFLQRQANPLHAAKVGNLILLENSEAISTSADSSIWHAPNSNIAPVDDAGSPLHFVPMSKAELKLFNNSGDTTFVVCIPMIIDIRTAMNESFSLSPAQLEMYEYENLRIDNMSAAAQY